MDPLLLEAGHYALDLQKGISTKRLQRNCMSLPATRRKIHATELTDWDQWCFLLVLQDLELNMKKELLISTTTCKSTCSRR